MENVRITKTGDGRVRRSRERLRRAMIELLMERPYDAVRMADILERADVGRATFYAHYRDKDDLLFSMFGEMIDFLEARAAAGGVQGPLPVTRLLLGHFFEAQEFCRALARSDKVDVLLRACEARLQRSAAARLGDDGGLAPAFAAGTFTTVFRWWFGRGFRPGPDAAADLYDGLVARGLQTAGAQPPGGPE